MNTMQATQPIPPGHRLLQCKLHHEWGEKVFVDDTLYTIDRQSGQLLVPDHVAPLLLQNANKWDDPFKPQRTPGTKPNGAASTNAIPLPPVELRDPKTGEILSPEETIAAIAEAKRLEALGEGGEHLSDEQLASQALSKSNALGSATPGEGGTTDALAAAVGQGAGQHANVDDARAQAAQTGAVQTTTAPDATAVENAVGDAQAREKTNPADDPAVQAELAKMQQAEAIDEGTPSVDDPPEGYPAVSMKSSHKDLDKVIKKLDKNFDLNLGKKRIKDKLEAIEAAYDELRSAPE